MDEKRKRIVLGKKKVNEDVGSTVENENVGIKRRMTASHRRLLEHERQGLIGRMPTPIDTHFSDEDEHVNPEEQRQMLEILKTKRSTQAGKSLVGSGSGRNPSSTPILDDPLDDPSFEDIEEPSHQVTRKTTRGQGSKKSGPNKPTWILTEGVDGGPQDPSLLTGFRAHIAYAIWQGEVLLKHFSTSRIALCY